MGEGRVFAMPDDMIDLAMRTTRLGSGFAERRENLSNRMAAFLDGGWTGGAGSTFREAFALFEKGAKDVQKGLDLLGEDVREGARLYQGQESANQRALTIDQHSPTVKDTSSGGFNW
ncbi:MAG: WXG100 family type VII secretion target [Segniliparus sp.]|uniref:WXG100 family type VII secretion target n=1 Tax=Segniliparus sp. TaxID=2804064 RepID=UPI003F2FC0F4